MILSQTYPLTIMILIDFLKEMGGAERNLDLLARGLRTRGHKVVICCLQGGKMSERMNEDGFYVLELNTPKIYDFKGIVAAIKMIKIIKREKVSVMITYHESSDFLGLLVARLANIAVVSTRRDMGFQLKLRHTWAYRLINPFFDQITTVSSAVKEMIIRTQWAKSLNVMVVSNGVELLPKTEGPLNRVSVKEFDAKCLNICCLANIRPIKGQKDLVEAAALIVRQIPSARFFLVGNQNVEKAYCARLEARVRDLGLQEVVRFTGSIPPHQVPPLIASMDISVSSSLSEGMSNAILESMAAGKPVVATAVGGNCQLVEDGKTGYLVPPSAPQSMAEALLKLSNPELRHRMGLRARSRVSSKFCVMRMIERYEDLLKYVDLRRKVSRWRRCCVRLLKISQACRSWVKIFTASIVYHCRLIYAVRSIKRALHLGKVKILCFHDISESTEKAGSPFSIVLPAEPFVGFLRFLASNYKVVSLEEAVGLLESGQSLTEDVFALTFDDCYKGWIRHVMPECKREQVPYATFLATEPLDSGRPLFYDSLIFLAENTWRKVADLSPWQSGVFLLDSPYGILAFVEEVHNIWLRRSKDERNRFLELLSEYLEVSLNSDNFRNTLLCWNDVQKMDMAGVTIGAHSVSHSCLLDLSETERSREIHLSKTRIEKELGHPIDFFAYPYGLFNDQKCDATKLVAKAGFRNAFTLDERHSDGGRPFEIGRRSVSRGMFVDPCGKFRKTLLATELSGLGDVIFGRVLFREQRSHRLQIGAYQ